MSREPTVFSRWSQRKRAVAAEAEAEAARVEEDQPVKEASPEEELTEAEVLEQLGLRDPDEMEQGDDFAAFLKEGVPEALKNRALRRLWRSNPVLANLDGMVDYGQDFTDSAMVPETMNTLYQVGKGMLRTVMEKPEVEVETAEDILQVVETNGINQETLAALDDAETRDEPSEGDPENDMNIAGEDSEIEQENEIRPRRMAFRVD